MKRDRTKAVLAGLIVAGFFGVLLFLVWTVVQNQELDLRDILLMMVGGLVAKFGTVIDYTFGSSQGSDSKSAIMEKMLVPTQRISDD